MANRTVKDAHTVKGTNPQYIIEKIIRTRIYESKYWKEECFALSADLIVDKGMELRFIGGVYGGNVKPTPFLCLMLKLLQIQPEKDIIVEFIRQENFKYVRALGAMYMRLTGTSTEIFNYLEPLYNDYRKLRFMNKMGEFELLHFDEFIDQLLRDERVCDVQLPRLQKRDILEQQGDLEPRVSALEEDIANVSSSDSEPEKEPSPRKKSPDHRRRSPSPRRRRSRSRERMPAARRSRTPPPRERERERYTERRRTPPRRPSDNKQRPRQDDNRKRVRENSYDREIREANELRAKLGLAPLQQ